MTKVNKISSEKMLYFCAIRSNSGKIPQNHSSSPGTQAAAGPPADGAESTEKAASV